MLNAYRKGAASLATALTFVAGVASAEEHSVIIFELAYFPAVIYVQPGDTIIFTNESGGEHIVTGNNEAWTTGPISSGTEAILVIEPDMQSTFGGEAANAEYIEGNLNFNPPPNL